MATGAATITGNKAAAVVRVTSGNFLEMYDFFLFGLYAKDVSRAFFPTGNEYAALMFTFMAFGISFLMRPLGAIFLGAYVDRVGRRQGLLVTLGLMAAGTALMAFTPGYGTIGLLAPALIVFGRLLQGFSAGVELGGVSVYLSEIATPGRKGFYVSWQSASQQVAVMVGALLGFLIKDALGEDMVNAWGWRIPFFFGCLIVPFLYIVRRSLEETPVFLRRTHRPDTREILRSLWANGTTVLLGMLLVVMTTVSFYFITVYTPVFANNVLHLSETASLAVTFCVALSNFIWLPIMGAVSDRVGRKPLLLLFSVLTAVTAYPVLAWLVAHVSFGNMLLALLWLSFLYGSYNGAMVVALTEVVPAHVRTSGFSLAYSLATALFGGFTPAVSQWIIGRSGDRASPGWWLAFAGLCGALATLALYRRRPEPALTSAAAPGD